MSLLSTAQKTSVQFIDWQTAKKERAQQAKTIREAMESDRTLEDLAEAKKQAAAEYKAEKQQWDAKNEAALARLDELKEAEQEAKLSFDALYVSCVMGGEQLSLFDDFGAEVELVTRVRIEKRDKKAEPVAQD